MVSVTERAIQQIVGLMEKEGITPKTHNLRVGVIGGGCSGLSYQMKFDDKIEPTDTVIDLESIKVCINKLSLLYLAGTEMDYQDGLNGKGFEWRNPNATRTCGCGESFSL
jgi:iron-sulfur cluster assembly protein